MRSLGVDLTAHRSRTVDAGMLARADAVFVMEPDHLTQALAMNPACKDRLFMLGALDPDSRDYVIQDPYATDTRTYTAVYEKIMRCVDAWRRLSQPTSEAARRMPATASSPALSASSNRPNSGLSRSSTPISLAPAISGTTISELDAPSQAI